MMVEWIRWEPAENLEGDYFVTALLLENGLVIRLCNYNDHKNIEIIFTCVDAYRYTNESFSFDMTKDLVKNYGRSFYVNWSFFKIKNSEYLQWLSKTSYGLSDEFPLQHFFILGGDEVVDVISRFEPDIKIIQELRH